MKNLIVRIVILLILLCLLSAASCTNKEDSVPIELDGSQWALISLEGNELIEGSHISLYFRNGTVWGSAGCNIYSGDYLTEYPDILTIPPVGQHQLFCSFPEGIIEQENIYTRSLTNAAFYRVAGEHLEIYNADNHKLLTFERKPEYPMDPADLVGTSWQLVSMNGEKIIEGLSITLTFDSDSEATGRAGCFDYELLGYKASGDDIRWGMSTGRNGELPQELEFQALRYTSSIMWGANYRIMPDALEIYTAKGDILVYKPSEEKNIPDVGQEPGIFRSDEFYLEVQLPQGWAAIEGPEYLAKPFEGQVAFNSWGQYDFWAREVCTEITSDHTKYEYGPQIVMSQIPAGGAYVALVRISGPPRPTDEHLPSEYTLNDLSGLWQPHDCRQDAKSGAQFIEFFKWGRDLQLVVGCHPNTSSETVTELNDLLQSWRFDSVPVGDIEWAGIEARQLLPEEVQPLKFSNTAGMCSDYGVIRITKAEVHGDTVHFRFMYRWNVPPPPRTTTSECPDDSCHWWEINVLPTGETFLVDEGGAPLPVE